MLRILFHHSGVDSIGAQYRISGCDDRHSYTVSLQYSHSRQNNHPDGEDCHVTWRCGTGPFGRIVQVIQLGKRRLVCPPCMANFPPSDTGESHTLHPFLVLCTHSTSLFGHPMTRIDLHGERDGAHHVVHLPISVDGVYPMHPRGLFIQGNSGCGAVNHHYGGGGGGDGGGGRDGRGGTRGELYALVNPFSKPTLVQVLNTGANNVLCIDKLLHVERKHAQWVIAFDSGRRTHFVASYSGYSSDLNVLGELSTNTAVAGGQMDDATSCSSQAVVCPDLKGGSATIGLLSNGKAVLHRRPLVGTWNTNSLESVAITGTVQSMASSDKWILFLKTSSGGAVVSLHRGMYHVYDIAIPPHSPYKSLSIPYSAIEADHRGNDDDDEEMSRSGGSSSIANAISARLISHDGELIFYAKIETLNTNDELIKIVMDTLDCVLTADHNGCLVFRNILSVAVQLRETANSQQESNSHGSDWDYLVQAILDTARQCGPRWKSQMLVGLHLLLQGIRLSRTLNIHAKRLVGSLLLPLASHLGWVHYVEYYEQLEAVRSLNIAKWVPKPASVQWDGATSRIQNVPHDIALNPPDVFTWTLQRLRHPRSDVLFPILGDSETRLQNDTHNAIGRLRLVCRLVHYFTCNGNNSMSAQFAPTGGREHRLGDQLVADTKAHERLVLVLAEELQPPFSQHLRAQNLRQRMEWLIDDLPHCFSMIIRDCTEQCRIDTPSLSPKSVQSSSHILANFYHLIDRQDLIRQGVDNHTNIHSTQGASPLGLSVSSATNDMFISVHEDIYSETVIRPVIKQRQHQQPHSHQQPAWQQMQRMQQQQQQLQQRRKKGDSVGDPRLSTDLQKQYEQLLSTLVFPRDKRLNEVWCLLQTSRPQKMRVPLAALIELSDPSKVENIEDTNSPEHQQLLQYIAVQVLALPIGRGMLTLSTRAVDPADSEASIGRPEMDRLYVAPLVLAARVEKSRGKYIILDASSVFQPYDPSSINEQHIQTISWPEFHNSVAAALTLAGTSDHVNTGARDSGRITREWILYHYRDGAKPSEHKPTYSQAGLLLGLGLQGHLKQLSRTDVYSIMKMMHDPTNIAILLGMSCSLVGTQDAQFTRTLSLHIPSLVVGTAMQINSEVQNAALVGMGLLYCGSVNRFMTEVLLNELAIAHDDHSINSLSSSGAGNARGGSTAGAPSSSCTIAIHFMFYNSVNMTGINVTNFNTNRDREAYSLSAGFGIGLINLGKGGSVGNKWIDDRLLRYMEGGKRPLSDPMMRQRQHQLSQTSFGDVDDVDGSGGGFHFDRSNHFYKFLGGSANLVPATGDSSQQGHDDSSGIGNNSRLCFETEELVNVGVTGPGACVALTLMYLKSNKEKIAARLRVPKTWYLLDAVSPVMLTLRTMGASLVMWDSICPTIEWVDAQVPAVVFQVLETARRSTLQSHMEDEQELEIYAETYFHIVAGCCLAIGLRYAGSHSKIAYVLCEEIFRQIRDGRFPADVSAARRRQLSRGRELMSKYSRDSCTMTVLFAMCCVMSGSGYLPLMQIVRHMLLQQQNMFHQQRQQCQRQEAGISSEGVDGVTNNTYALQLGLSMCMGLLFLGGGTITLSTSNLSIACLLMALYPQLPQHPLDNTFHHQVLRHLYVLACTDQVKHNGIEQMDRVAMLGGKLLQTVDLETGRICHVPVRITLSHKSGDKVFHEHLYKTSPCLLPSDISMVSSIEIGADAIDIGSEANDISTHQSTTQYYPQSFSSADALVELIRVNREDSRIVVEVSLKRKSASDEIRLDSNSESRSRNRALERSYRSSMVTSTVVNDVFGGDVVSRGEQFDMKELDIISAARRRLLALSESEQGRQEWEVPFTLHSHDIWQAKRKLEKRLLSNVDAAVQALRWYYSTTSSSSSSHSSSQREDDDLRTRCMELVHAFRLPTRTELHEALSPERCHLPREVLLRDRTLCASVLSVLFRRISSAQILDIIARALCFNGGQ